MLQNNEEEKKVKSENEDNNNILSSLESNISEPPEQSSAILQGNEPVYPDRNAITAKWDNHRPLLDNFNQTFKSPEQLEAERKKLDTKNTIVSRIANITDAISALANVYHTNKGGVSLNINPASREVDKKIESLKQKREQNYQNYLNAYNRANEGDLRDRERLADKEYNDAMYKYRLGQDEKRYNDSISRQNEDRLYNRKRQEEADKRNQANADRNYNLQRQSHADQAQYRQDTLEANKEEKKQKQLAQKSAIVKKYNENYPVTITGKNGNLTTASIPKFVVDNAYSLNSVYNAIKKDMPDLDLRRETSGSIDLISASEKEKIAYVVAKHYSNSPSAQATIEALKKQGMDEESKYLGIDGIAESNQEAKTNDNSDIIADSNANTAIAVKAKRSDLEKAITSGKDEREQKINILKVLKEAGHSKEECMNILNQIIQ